MLSPAMPAGATLFAFQRLPVSQAFFHSLSIGALPMRILYINNDGGGFADHIEIAEGTTVEQLFHDRIPQGKPHNYLIRVDRQPAASGDVLREGQRVSFTPTKIEGAKPDLASRSPGLA
jgi:hypothetical protein